MEEKLATIYKITNNITKATYIGQTTMTLKKRWNFHKGSARDGVFKPLYIAIREYGEENFSIEEIDYTFYRHRFIVENDYIEKEIKKNHVCYNINVKGKEFKEVMSLVTSGSKNGMYNKKGENSINGQTVHMIDDNGKIIREFKSVSLALEYIGVKSHTAFYKACKENSKYKGYFWKKTNKNYL